MTGPFRIDARWVNHIHRWGTATFGPGDRTPGILDHLHHELGEVADDPGDASEWADVILLALDGAVCSGISPQAVLEAVAAKQKKNERRTWPDWRTQPPGKAIGHMKTEHAQPVEVTVVDGFKVGDIPRLKLREALVDAGWYLMFAANGWQIHAAPDDWCAIQVFANGEVALSIEEGDPPTWFPASCPNSVILAAVGGVPDGPVGSRRTAGLIETVNKFSPSVDGADSNDPKTVHSVAVCRPELRRCLADDGWIEWGGDFYSHHPTSARFAIQVCITMDGVAIMFAPGDKYTVTFPADCPDSVVLVTARELRHRAAQ